MICLGGFSLDPRSALVAGLGLALPLALAGPAAAQDRPAQVAQSDKTDKLNAIKQHNEELKATRAQQRKSADTDRKSVV